MASNEQGSIPNKYMLLNYRPRDGAIVIVPLSENTRTGSGRLTDLYRQGGARAVMSGIESTLGVECEFYVLFDRSSFTGFISPLGEVLMRIPYDFTGGGINISAGEHRLSGGDLFTYMNLFNPADFPQAGSDYNLVIMGTAITTLLNLNCRNMDSETIQDAFNKILNNATTNLTFRDFTAYQRALLYTSENSFNPASYYLPTGHHELGEFIISNQSIANILDRFNLRAEHMGD
jgi:anionic cell wall polymer biosynthesis LytR-Cps2A-Psr (LCP) family protein